MVASVLSGCGSHAGSSQAEADSSTAAETTASAITPDAKATGQTLDAGVSVGKTEGA